MKLDGFQQIFLDIFTYSESPSLAILFDMAFIRYEKANPEIPNQTVLLVLKHVQSRCKLLETHSAVHDL